MTVYIDKLVLMEHPNMYDIHVLAKVVAQTAKTVQVMYWSTRLGDWTENTARRNISSNFRIIHDNLDELAPDQLNKLAAQLVSAKAELDRRRSAAEIAFRRTIKELKIS